ncbi:DNA-directed DNA polymerase II small subunit [Halodesulfurarchaeum sp.]|uniref:DNA-directed DNA polymerase II small subunit n=1 Tax=Halodesulfurarchaeum sp. TaxID=1980530 RepID=UPI001BBCD348|nr:DNA-directed DNA polymerase II small subunit [Halodesulfurarchaeum sp.]
MPRSLPVRIVKRLTAAGLNADREAVTLLAGAGDPAQAVEAVLDRIDQEAVTVTTADVRPVLDDDRVRTDTNVSTGGQNGNNQTTEADSTAEIKGVKTTESTSSRAERDPDSPSVSEDVTGASTGTGVYEDFVAVFRDRYDRLSSILRGRVNHRPTDALESMAGGADGALIGLVTDVRSTRNGHHLVELEDTNGTFPILVMKDRPFADAVDELLLDEVIAVEGTLSDDSSILFANTIHFPDVPRTFDPSTADRHVQAALVSDLHVGSQEFLNGAWSRFTDWLHTAAADPVEYLLIAGDMVEGVGVYPDQDEELDVVDIFEQYERFAEHLKAVPGDMEIVMIPGNHDAVRLAEPQPAFDSELREIMSAHDATITGNPSMVTIEGVSVLMYHGVSLDELVAELPLESVSYEHPAQAMAQLLKKRHLAPKFGGENRIAPEKRDYLLIEDVPDVLHSGHVHKLGVDAYHKVRLVNSGCFQGQTAFQRSVNITPDTGTVPILDLDTLDVTVRKFT